MRVLQERPNWSGRMVRGKSHPCLPILFGITAGIKPCQNDAKRRQMKTVRRLYVYLVTLISLEVVLWGLISLLRSIVDETVGGGAEVLAQALALILVGVPIFLVHWLWAQNTSKRDDEEKTAGLRALFFYSVL